MVLEVTEAIVHGPARPEIHTCMPTLKTVPLGDEPEKQPAVTQVSVLVGRPSGPVGCTVMFIEAGRRHLLGLGDVNGRHGARRRR